MVYMLGGFLQVICADCIPQVLYIHVSQHDTRNRASLDLELGLDS